MPIQLRLGRGLLQAALVTLIAAFLVIQPASTRTAQAGLGACLDAASESLELGKYLAEQVGKLGLCSDKLSQSPPVSAAVVTLLTALAIAGEFSNESECTGLVGTTVAAMLGAILSEAPVVKDTMVDIFGQKAVDGLLNTAGQNAADQLSQIPGMDQVFGVLTCGCTMVGTVLETKDKITEIAKSLDSCADVVDEAAAALVGALQSGQDWLFGAHKGDWGTALTVDPKNICDSALMVASQYDVYTYDFAVKNAGLTYYPSENIPKSCTCPQGASVVYHPSKTGGVALIECSCGEGQYLHDKTCKSLCAFGMKWDSAQQTCAPRCAENGTWDGYNCIYHCAADNAVYNTTSNKCEVCQPGTQAVFALNNGADNGYCRTCADDEKVSADGKKCEPACGQEWLEFKKDGWAGAGCYPRCADGKRYQPAGEFNYACSSCGQGTSYDLATNTCKACPQGATWSADNGVNGSAVCRCPQGQSNVNGVCQACPEGTAISVNFDGSSTCVACPTCGDKTPRPARDCGPNGIPDPKRPYTACIPCAEGTHAMGAYCVSDKPVSASVSETGRLAVGALAKAVATQALLRDADKAGKCPPGWTPNGPYCMQSALPDQSKRKMETKADCTSRSNFVNDPKDPSKCMPCAAGRVPNKAHTACVASAAAAPGEKQAPEKQAPKTGKSIAPNLDFDSPFGGGSHAPGQAPAFNRPGGGGASPLPTRR